MLLDRVKVKVNESLISKADQIILSGGVIGVTVEKIGTATPILGWNEAAKAGKGQVSTSRSYGLGYPVVLDGNKLNIDFEAGGTKKVLVTTFTLVNECK
jgi:hypothetical protein